MPDSRDQARDPELGQARGPEDGAGLDGENVLGAVPTGWTATRGERGAGHF